MLLKVTFNVAKRDHCNVATVGCGLIIFKRRRRLIPYAFFYWLLGVGLGQYRFKLRLCILGLIPK